VLDDSIKDMNEFLQNLNKFEKITNSRLVDLWQIKDTAFQPLRVSIDVQEYMPGLFDMLNPNKDNELSKVMSVFAFLQVETFNLKNEIETKYFDSLILFGESGLVYEDASEEKMAGEYEIQMSRMLTVYRDMFDLIKKAVAVTKNIIYQMNGLFRGKTKLYVELLKKNKVYLEIFDNLGGILSSLYTIDLIIMDNVNFHNYW
jgi:WASH complex subunit 7, N-terminal